MMAGITPLDAAEILRARLADRGIDADVNSGYGLAVVSVWAGLVVWCDLDRYWWRIGWAARQRRPIYAFHPIVDPVRAAVRVARRYDQVREADRGVVLQGGASCLPL